MASSRRECPVCKGNTKCPNCDGHGSPFDAIGAILTFGIGARNSTCKPCKGSGRCPRCHGKGHIPVDRK